MTGDERQEPHVTSGEILRLLGERGGARYGGEAVSQLEHALQAAWFAEQEGAPASLIVAALLHDVGHLLHELPDDAAEHGLDDRHERLGAEWLAARFQPEIAAAVAMHVDAKRYLCAADPAYRSTLSPASLLSLELQGGAMNEAERRQFESQAGFEAAVRLRRWDDAAKVVGLKTARLDHYGVLLEQALRESSE